MEELHLEAYENSRNYDHQILRKEFRVSQKVLLFNLQLKLIIVELKDGNIDNTFQVNGHQIKLFHESLASTVAEMETESAPTPVPSWPDSDRLRLCFNSCFITSQSQKTMINLNLRGQRSFGIVLEMGLVKCGGDTQGHSKSCASKKRCKRKERKTIAEMKQRKGKQPKVRSYNKNAAQNCKTRSEKKKKRKMKKGKKRSEQGYFQIESQCLEDILHTCELVPHCSSPPYGCLFAIDVEKAQKEHLGPEEAIPARPAVLAKHGGTRSFSKVSLSIEEVQDQELGSWKLSKVITRYSRHTLVGKNLNAWPLVVNHCCPSKAIVVEGRFSGIFELSPFRERDSSTPSYLSKCVRSPNRVGFVSTETELDQSLPS
ncbi:hypothetical protein CR513_29044, partial [Mucuna pruriens]